MQKDLEYNKNLNASLKTDLSFYKNENALLKEKLNGKSIR